MKIENIDEAYVLITSRNTLTNIVNKSVDWKHGHFELVEHCGNAPDRVSVTYFPELTNKIIKLIKDEIEIIDKKISEL